MKNHDSIMEKGLAEENQSIISLRENLQSEKGKIKKSPMKKEKMLSIII